MKTHRTFI